MDLNENDLLFDSQRLFDKIPEYNQIINDLSKGNLKANFILNNRKSKLSHCLKDILFDEQNDELSYFILFMDSRNASNYVKFLLDLSNFSLTSKKKHKCKDLEDNESSDQSNESIKKCISCKNFAQDAISIFEIYISKDAKYSIQPSDELIQEIIKNICPEKNQKINPNCFEPAKEYVLNQIEQYYDKYLTSEYHCKYLKNILDNQNLILSDILYDDFAVVFFLEYLEQEKVSDLLKFFMQADNFNRNLQNLKSSNQFSNLKHSKNKSDIENLFIQWQNDAMIIYDNYISLQPKNALGFDSLVRRQVELNICQHNENEKEDLEYFINSYSNCFYIPLLIVFSIMDKVYFNKFLNSPLYKKYIQEILLNTIFVSDLNQHENKTEKTSQNKKKDELITNEPLWLNDLAKNMQIGSIDSTGRFVRYFKNDTLINETEYSINCQKTQSYDNNEAVIDDDDAWNLNSISSIDTSESVKGLNSIFKLKNKFEKFINRIPLNSRSKFTNDDYEVAEKIAANLVNEVIQINQV